MKKRFLNVFFGRILLYGLLAVALLHFKTPAQDKFVLSDGEAFGFGARGVEGTWQAQTTILNCQTGNVMENFTKLVSFNQGGTMGETSSSSLFRSTAFGIWGHTGVNSFRYAQRFFRFNPDGTPAGSVRAQWLVLIDPAANTYTGEAAIQIVAPNGMVVANLCGAETAVRIIFDD